MFLAATRIPYGPHWRQRVDCFVPQQGGDLLTVCLHGGWFHDGERGDLHPTAMALAEQGLPAAVIGVRHWQDGGASTGGDFVADVIAGLTTLKKEFPLLGGDGWRLVLLGSGSGGLLARNVAAQLPAPWLPAGVITAGCPATTVTDPEIWPDCPGPIKTALRDFDEVTAPDDLLPPHLVLHGAKDDQVPPTMARQWYGSLIDCGIPAQLAVLADAEHRFLRYPSSPAGSRALDKIVAWINERRGN
jgi:acetyl esterase/lipase